MKQILIIHGGESYNSYDTYLTKLRSKRVDYERLKVHQKWKPWIANQIKDADVLLPEFPNAWNAVYDEWKLYFEKLIPFFGNDVQLVGHSLGAMFLAKYLHEVPLKQKVKRLVLVAAVYDNDFTGDNGSFLVGDARGLEKSADEIHLFHSEDDPLVPFSELAKFHRDLPDAIVHTFENRGHFIEETFPEMLELLKKK